MRLNLSLAQMNIALGDPAANLAKAEQFVAEAARRQSDLVVFPELWTTGYAWDTVDELIPWQEDVVNSIGKLAKKHQIWVHGSVLVLNEEGRAANTALLFNDKGEIAATYRKVHLFGLMDEDQYLAGGTELILAETPWGKHGLTVCYDLRFPEMFREYAVNGANIVFVPAEWPHPRLNHWRTLLQARAIENQMYIVAVNRVGEDKNNTFCGHSMIIDPWGNIAIEAGDDELLLTLTIETDTVAEVRRKIPVFADRRPALYTLR